MCATASSWTWGTCGNAARARKVTFRRNYARTGASAQKFDGFGVERME